MTQAFTNAAVLDQRAGRLAARRGEPGHALKFGALWLLAPSLFLLFLFTYVPILQALLQAVTLE